METSNMFRRCIALFGKENFDIICNAKVMIIGLGAVGGYALETIVRTGVNNIVVVDFDEFEESNLNRQILATMNTLGAKKCNVARDRILEINPNANVKVYDLKIKKEVLSFIKDEMVSSCLSFNFFKSFTILLIFSGLLDSVSKNSLGVTLRYSQI